MHSEELRHVSVTATTRCCLLYTSSGCINQSGLLTLKVTKSFGESTVSKITDLVENALSLIHIYTLVIIYKCVDTFSLKRPKLTRF